MNNNVEIIFLQMFLECSALYCEGFGFFALGKNVLHSKQNKGQHFKFLFFMMRLPPSFQIHHALAVISGKGLCTNETPVFTQPEPVSEVREGME